MDIDVTWNNCLAVCLIFVKMAPSYLVSHVQSSALILQLLWFSSCNIQPSWGWGNRNLYFLMHHEQSLSPCCIGKNGWALATCWGWRWFPFAFRFIHPSVLAVMNELKGESDDKMLSLFVNLFCKSLWDKKCVHPAANHTSECRCSGFPVFSWSLFQPVTDSWSHPGLFKLQNYSTAALKKIHQNYVSLIITLWGILAIVRNIPSFLEYSKKFVD